MGGGCIKRIIGIEPDPLNVERSIKRLEAINVPIEIISCGLGSEKGKMGFELNRVHSACSRVDEKGSYLVDIDTIDNILDGEKATLIKMDIEGAELEALKGASNTIKAYKPKLAISIYHKNEDIFTIPSYILQLRDDYKFYMRQYTYDWGETVFFAV